MRLPCALALFVFGLAASSAAASDIFVNNVIGNDLFDGSSDRALSDRIGPTYSITKALRVARFGDRIVIANTGQPYRESITLQGGNHSGDSYHPFTLEGNGAVLDGTMPIPPRTWEHFAGDVFRFRPPTVHYQQLFLSGVPLVKHPAAAGAYQPPALEPLEWALVQGEIYFRVQKGRLPEDYELSHAGAWTGITVYQVRHAAVLDLVVQGFSVDGVNVHDGLGPCYLAGLTCRGNGRAGIGVVGATRVQIESCLLGDNGESQLYVEGFTETYVNGSDLIDNTAPAWRVKGGRLYLDGVRVRGSSDEQREDGETEPAK